MIVGDDLGEHRHCDLAGPFPADVHRAIGLSVTTRIRPYAGRSSDHG
jgi:hypothetical protein